MLLASCAGFALAQVESGRLDAPVPICPCCGDHRARVDAEQQRDHHDQQSAEAAADRNSATGPAAPPARDGARVDLHTLVEGHRTAPSLATPCLDPGASSFAHYDLGVAVLLGHSTVAHTALGDLRGTTEGGVGVWRGVPYAEQPVGERRFLAPAPLQPWTGVRDALEHGPLPPQRQVVRRRWSRRPEGARRGLSDADGVVARHQRFAAGDGVDSRRRIRIRRGPVPALQRVAAGRQRKRGGRQRHLPDRRVRRLRTQRPRRRIRRQSRAA